MTGGQDNRLGGGTDSGEAGSLEFYGDFDTAMEKNGAFVTVLNGVSMYPMVRNLKDPVMMVPVGEAEKLRPYDVAVYTCGDNFLVHRVLKVCSRGYLIRGDNCVMVESVPFSAVRARVEGFWRFGRYVPVSNGLYKFYARLWVKANPLLRLERKLMSLAARCVKQASRSD